MTQVYASASCQSAAIDDVKAAGPVVSAIIARVEALLAKYGPSILAELPAILAAAGVPTWLVPLVEEIATMLSAKTAA